MAPDKQVEDVVILLDTSRSMARTDYKPNRLEACKSAIIAFIKTRLNHITSNFSLVTFGSRVQHVVEFANYAEPFEEALRSVKFGGASALGDAMAKGIQILIGELRKVGAKVPRILILSDGKFTQTSIDPVKMAKLCKGLNIHVDTIRLGDVEHFNVLKRLSGMTDGQYFYAQNAQDMVSTAITLAEQSQTHSFDREEAPAPLLARIAGKLLKVSELSSEQRTSIQDYFGANSSKCVICFKSEDPTTKTAFAVSGRHCPNCHAPMHTTCAAMWAAQDEKATDQVFRCPHCFYLLKIPRAVQQARRLHEQMKANARSAPQQEAKSFYVQRVPASTLGDAALYNACPVCHLIFEEDEEVIPCTNQECSAIYHPACFSKLQGGHCKRCGSKLTLV
ncbi:MAG: hypothetical protein Kow0069_32800 [Promethearchaeota archaeon]